MLCKVFTRGSQFRVESIMVRLAHLKNQIVLSPSKQQVPHLSQFLAHAYIVALSQALTICLSLVGSRAEGTGGNSSHP